MRGERPGGDDHGHRGNRRDRLRPLARPDHRPCEHDEQGSKGHGL
jgi:hypothetical protein